MGKAKIVSKFIFWALALSPLRGAPPKVEPKK